MRDRISTEVLSNGAIRYGVYDESGVLLRYEYIKPEDGPLDEGTPINKATFLKDATAAAYGLNNDAVPDNVFARLAVRTAVLNLHTVPNAHVSMSLESVTITATADASGGAILYPDRIGTWNVTIITSNTTYIIPFEITSISTIEATLPSFNDMSWTDINDMAQRDFAESLFAIGDEKTIILTTGEDVTLRIEDFNHDDLTAGGKAKITIGMKNLLANIQAISNSGNNGGWGNCVFRNTNIPVYLSQLPIDLQSVIKPVDKKGTVGSQSTSIQTTSDKLWLFAVAEVGVDGSAAGYKDEGTGYPLFIDNQSRIKYLSNGLGNANYWWTRSPVVSNTTSWRAITPSGSGGSATPTLGVCLGFCI